MGTVSAWIQQLGFLILLAGLVDLILPNTSVRKVTRLVVGLVIILAILDPLVGWVTEPDWINSLFADALQADGQRFIREGVELAQGAQAQAHALWLQQVQRDVGVVLTLVAGIHDAEVQVVSSPADTGWRVHLHLWSNVGADDPAASLEWRARTEEEVVHLTRKLLHPTEVRQVQISWNEAKVGGL